MYIRFLMGIIMARSAESILEDIYDELKKNSKSSGLNDKSYNDLLKELKRNNNSGDSSGSDDKKKKDGGLFNFIKKKAQDLGGTVGRITDDLADLSDPSLSPAKRIKAGLDSIGEVISMIPLIGGFFQKVFTLAESVFLGVYNKLNSWYGQYSAFNTSGMYSSEGMVGLQKVLGSTMMTFDEYSKVIASNKDALVSFGSNSGMVFSGLLNDLVNTQSKYGALNMSIDQMGVYILSNIKALKMQGSFNKMTDMQKKQSDREYMDQLNAFSKVLGISTDELNKNINGQKGMINKAAMQSTLMGHGMKQDIADVSTRNMQMALKSMGEVGDMFLDSMTEYSATGVIANGSALGQDFLKVGDNAMRGVLSSIGAGLNAGKFSGKDGAGAIAQSIYDNRDKMLQSLSLSMQQAVRLGDAGAMAHIGKVMETLQTMANPAEAIAEMKKRKPFDEFVNNFNNTARALGSKINEKFYSAIGRTEGTFKSIFDGFSGAMSGDSTWTAAFKNLGEKIPDLIHDFFGKDLGDWILGKKDGKELVRSFSNLDTALQGTINLTDVIESIFPKWLANIIEGKSTVSQGLSEVMPSVREMLKGMGFKDWILDLLFDKPPVVQGPNKDMLQENINELNHNTNTFMGTLNENIKIQSANMAAINDKSNSLLGTISNWFSSATSQSVGNLQPQPVPNGTPWQVQPEQSNVLPLPTSIIPQNAGWTGTIYQQNMVTTQLLENSQKQTEILQQISDSNDRTNNHLTNVRTN